MRPTHHTMPAAILCNRRFIEKHPKQLTPLHISARDWEEFAMPTDWRDDHQYDHFDDLGISGLAWECLRRNLHYRKDYDLMREGGSAPADWGLRFPCRSKTQCAQRTNLLAPIRSACGGPTHRCSAGHRLDRIHTPRKHCGPQNRRRRTVMGSAEERSQSCRGAGRRSTRWPPASARWRLAHSPRGCRSAVSPTHQWQCRSADHTTAT